MLLHRMFVSLSLLFFSTQIPAAPYIPDSDGKVLESLPFKANDPLAREISQLRSELLRSPRNVDVAVRLARRYYSLVGEEGDPRYLGYAQAALAPWWELPAPPVEVQVLRASLSQFRHDFSGAVNDLTQVLEREPRHAQARVLRATIHTVQARYSEAKADCQALHNVTSELIALGCEAMLDGLTGKAASAYQMLSDALKRYPDASTDSKLWVLIRLGEISQRLGRTVVAESHFKQAIALGVTDTFLLAAYADFLLEQQRPADVVGLLSSKTRSDTLLLRLVLAERRLNLPTAKAREETLAARYAAAQLRGDTAHQQEEARFALQVQHDPSKALNLARENWKVQLEPRDAKIFLEAALSAKDPAAAQPVFTWLEQGHIEDHELAGLAQQLRGARK